MKDQSNLEYDEVNLRELFAALWIHKIFIFLITSASLFVSGYYVANTEKKFTATTVFQISQEDSIGFNISSELGALASLVGVEGSPGSAVLLERVEKKVFISGFIEKYSLDFDPYFNTHDPDHRDAAWKAAIKKFLNWEETQAQRDAIVKNQIIENYRKSLEVSETDGGAISVSLTHTDPIKASQYANSFMKEIRKLVEKEKKEAQDLRLLYLSETLADALQEMETAQQNLKDYALQNSALADENFLSGSLKLDSIRTEKRKVEEIANLLFILEDVVKGGNLDTEAFEALRSSYPLVDDIDFRRILGMSETISAWTWPKTETIKAVSATLRDRIKRLEVDIKNIEESAQIYATSAEDLARYTRDAKIAEATYTVLIEQVKSQSLAAGFQPEAFKVFEYATPPIYPSSPKRNLIIILGALGGFFIGCSIILTYSIRRGVYYTKPALIFDAESKLSLKSKSIKRLSRRSISSIKTFISKNRLLEVDKAEIKLGNKKLVYVLNCGGKPTASDLARLLATKSSTSGRKVILCDYTAQSKKTTDREPFQHSCGLSIANLDDNMSIILEPQGSSLFTSPSLDVKIKGLLSDFDQAFLCSTNKEATLGLMALKDLDPSIVVIAGLRSTSKLDIKNIKETSPIDILFYD